MEVLVALADTSVSRKDKILGIAGPLAEELKETNELTLFSVGSQKVIYRNVEYELISDKAYTRKRFPDEETFIPVRELGYRSIK